MKIATWNVNSLKVRFEQLTQWLEHSECDVIAIQETKTENHNFPLNELKKLGFYCAFNGEKQYNGVAIISKFPLENITLDIPNFVDNQKRVIGSTINDIRIICVYVVNGESLASDKYIYKLQWIKHLYQYIKTSIMQNNKLIVLGDFNIAPKDEDIYDFILFDNKVLCSKSEREAFQQILALGLHDSFRLFNTDNKQFTWWDYRNMSFKRNLGARIDHILVSDAIKNITKSVTIDKTPRKNDRPSDHTPVIIDLL